MLSHRCVFIDDPAGNVVTITVTDSSEDPTDLTTYTFSTQAIGTASMDRIVIVGAIGRAGATGRTISSVTIGGNAAGSVGAAAAADDTTNSRVAQLFALLVTSGTTADIVVTFNSTMVRAGIVVWAMTGTGGSTNAHDSATSTASPATTTACSIPTNGGAVGVCYSTDANGRIWTGLTEDSDNAVESQYVGGAHKNVTTAEGSPTIEVDTTANSAMAVASFAPA